MGDHFTILNNMIHVFNISHQLRGNNDYYNFIGGGYLGGGYYEPNNEGYQVIFSIPYILIG
jgi:hypothetical protein